MSLVAMGECRTRVTRKIGAAASHGEVRDFLVVAQNKETKFDILARVTYALQINLQRKQVVCEIARKVVDGTSHEGLLVCVRKAGM